jgi:hypothetical protein
MAYYSGQYKGNLYCLVESYSFSGDAVECISWSRKLSNGEGGHRLDGYLQHVTICNKQSSNS